MTFTNQVKIALFAFLGAVLAALFGFAEPAKADFGARSGSSWSQSDTTTSFTETQDLKVEGKTVIDGVSIDANIYNGDIRDLGDISEATGGKDKPTTLPGSGNVWQGGYSYDQTNIWSVDKYKGTIDSTLQQDNTTSTMSDDHYYEYYSN